MYTSIISAGIASVAIALSAYGTNSNLVPFSDNETAKFFGALLDAIFYGATFGLLGSIIGKIVATVKGQDEVYDLSRMNLVQKKCTMTSIVTSLPSNQALLIILIKEKYL